MKPPRTLNNYELRLLHYLQHQLEHNTISFWSYHLALYEVYGE